MTRIEMTTLREADIGEMRRASAAKYAARAASM
jgi:hypothetical protein